MAKYRSSWLTIEDRDTSSNLPSGVEQGQEVQSTGIERSFGESEEESDSQHSVVVLDCGSTSRYTSPCTEMRSAMQIDRHYSTHTIQPAIQRDGRTRLVDINMFEGI